MPRTATKKKRGFMDGYRTYDASQGFGNVDDWIRMAEAAAAHVVAGGEPPAVSAGGADADLVMLNLEALPSDQDALRSAFRRALIPAHPDHGGSREKMEEVKAAWLRLIPRVRRAAA